MSNEGCNSCQDAPIPELDRIEKDILDVLAQTPFLPIARVVVSSVRPGSLDRDIIMLLIEHELASLKNALKLFIALTNLETLNIISIDFDIPIRNFNEGEFYTSEVYNSFIAVSEVDADISVEFGSIALSAFGIECLEHYEYSS